MKTTKRFFLTVLVLSAIATAAFAATATTTIGKSVTFSVTASGTAPFTFQWKKDGVVIPVATSISYQIPSVVIADSGTYTVTVTNSAGSTVSDNGVLTVNAVPPTLTPVVITISP